MIIKLKHLPYRVLKARKSGLVKHKEDSRDFHTGIFRWFSYTPKHTRHVIKTLSTRDQKTLNTCQWNGTCVQKEVGEKEQLNLKLFVNKAKRSGKLSGDGYSTLKDGQKLLQEWGIPARDVLPDIVERWSKYSNITNLSLYDNDAKQHKISSYWSVTSRNDSLKLLDEGKVISTGIDWYTGFNMGGGFSAPWIISKKIGWKVGGHAFVKIGYDLNYKGRKVYICQNSYGSKWGDKGKFYIDMDYLDKHNYGYYTNLDEIDVELGKFLIANDGKNVKGKGDSAIFYIQKGQKKPYPNWLAYLSFNGLQRGFTEVDKNLLDRVEKGDIMDVKKSNYWPFLQAVKKGNQLDQLLLLLNKEN